MRILAFLLAMTMLLLLSLTLKAEVDFRYRRIEEEDHIEIDFRAFHGLWHTQFQIPTLQLEWEKGPQVEIEQVAIAKGGTRKATKKARIRYIRRGWLFRFWLNIPRLLRRINRIKQQFYKGIHCKGINWRIEIGFPDAAQTAIAAGTFWTMLGFALSHLYQQVTVEVKRPALVVVPTFKKAGFLCDIRCIFQLRIGHIIFVGFNVLRTLRRGIRG
ncbi:DUF2953 domain-containing protein [Desulfosporosinus fructosivorans]|uniref:DUF2953 domain-containing protein n=1 Tax=Desulfosporosinus fructosivorans TaxID=2018669 RepID=A0A4Z0R6Y2_9FIRM|nr:DUF2953 domain-containing protein [Desulfosporosinus fructosivorans]TGE37747.1 DUF2953 domain-containing protein [Desulfosporosinus fructosivorans]